MALQLLWNPDACGLELPQPDKDHSQLHTWGACWPHYKAMKPTLNGMHRREAGLAGFQRKVQLAPVPPGSRDHLPGTQIHFPRRAKSRIFRDEVLPSPMGVPSHPRPTHTHYL